MKSCSLIEFILTIFKIVFKFILDWATTNQKWLIWLICLCPLLHPFSLPPWLSLPALLLKPTPHWPKVTVDNVAEWSKALASGASPQGRGFESHCCHTFLLSKVNIYILINNSQNSAVSTTLHYQLIQFQFHYFFKIFQIEEMLI